jgi:hypothetical protein
MAYITAITSPLQCLVSHSKGRLICHCLQMKNILITTFSARRQHKDEETAITEES